MKIGICEICNKEKKVRPQYRTGVLRCAPCVKKIAAKLGICEICEEEKNVRIQKETGILRCDLCSSKQYIRPSEICLFCGEKKEVNTRLDGNPVCFLCYRNYIQEKRNCSRCEKTKTIIGSIQGKEYCKVCHTIVRRKIDPAFAVMSTLRNRVRSSFCTFSKTGKTKTSNEYGINYQAIFEHIGPCPGDKKKYHIDHIKPLCLFDFNDPEQIKEAFAPENHQWLTAEENLKKGVKYVP